MNTVVIEFNVEHARKMLRAAENNKQHHKAKLAAPILPTRVATPEDYEQFREVEIHECRDWETIAERLIWALGANGAAV